MPADPPFWKTKSLSEMSRAEWESLCDGCGRCCLHKLRDEDSGELAFTNVACRLLHLETARCADYPNRQRWVPDCVKLTPARLKKIDWLPPSCAYRLLAEGQDLPWWHPLVSGRPDTVEEAGISVRGRIIRERDAGDLEDHVVDWPARIPKSARPRAGRPPDPKQGQRRMKDALFGGVNAAVLTAMQPDLAPDPARMARHCHWLLANGCNGLGVLGTTGEANSFGLHERKAILEGLVANGVPAARLMPGTGCASLTDTVELTRHARDQGCRGALLLPPFYYKGPSDDGLFAYFSEVIQRVGGGIALYLYHFPQQSAVPFSLSLIERLLKAHPGAVKGVKDSSGDYANMKAMIDAFARDGFEVYSGSDEFVQRILADGGAGCITAASNTNSHWGGIVYAKRSGPEADAAQAVLTATRKAATSVALISGQRELIARGTGDAGWRTIRPPHLPLNEADAQKIVAAYQAAGAWPLPGFATAKAAE